MKRRILIIIGVLIVLGGIVGSVIFFQSRQDNYKYSVEEQNWLDDHKNDIIDFYMPNDIASLTLAGDGLFFDFVDYFTNDTDITINPVAYNIGEEYSNEYGIVLVDKLADGDIKILDDNYVIVTKQNVIYPSVDAMTDLKIGYIKTEGQEVLDALGSTLNYVGFDSKDLMLQGMTNDTIDAFIGLKSIYLNDILLNNYHISYQIYDMNRSYVLRLAGSDDTLNDIFTKTYQRFNKEEYKKSYNKNLLGAYVNALNISEKDLSKLNSKVYTYGYVNNGIYDNTSHSTLTGINLFIIKNFADFANVDMDYHKQYSNLNDLHDAVNDGDIDFYFDNTNFNSENPSSTVTPVDARLVFLTHNNSHKTIINLNNLKGTKVLTIKDSKIEKLLTDNKIEVTSYDNYDKLIAAAGKKSIIAMELENYEYYKSRDLNKFHISYIYDLPINYGFMVNEENKTFLQLLNFYLEYTNLDTVTDYGYANAFEYEGLNIFLFIAVIILSLIIIFQFFGRIRKFIVYLFKHKKKSLSKDEKLKYIDNLTSLKNRAYLNDNITKWDESEIYPQIIIIVDLNSIAYINDNFGHEEGDKVITEAANILIQTQMPNTEIIRTDGNEFLIYMIEYEEKVAVSYIRKLNRAFKNLSHGFGAAIGYSIISDAIKTIDDAVNEATLDMRTNKELMNEEEK